MEIQTKLRLFYTKINGCWCEINRYIIMILSRNSKKQWITEAILRWGHVFRWGYVFHHTKICCSDAEFDSLQLRSYEPWRSGAPLARKRCFRRYSNPLCKSQNQNKLSHPSWRRPFQRVRSQVLAMSMNRVMCLTNWRTENCVLGGRMSCRFNVLVFLANTLRISLQVNLPILPVLRWAAVVEISQVAQPADRARAGLQLRSVPISNWHTLSTLTNANNLQHGNIILRCYHNLRLIETFLEDYTCHCFL